MSRAVKNAYRNGEDDETFPPLVLFNRKGLPAVRLKKGDAIIYYNIRGEREGELTQSLTDVGFDKFPVANDLTLHFATMIEYQKDLSVHVAFPPEGAIEDTLSEVIARHDLKQAKITESEKASHVGLFRLEEMSYSLTKLRRCPSTPSRKKPRKKFVTLLTILFS
jgi:2,3-bisphosphoglycerate-independent phosphoglycerate mutase